MNRIDIIIPTFSLKSKDMTITAVKSFLHFSNGFDFRIFVVENSNDISYRDEILSLSNKIKWIQNPTHHLGSNANAIAIDRATKEIKSDLVFICHNDVAACHPNWMKYLYDKIVNEDYSLCGFFTDPNPNRSKPIHISGLLVKTEILKKVNIWGSPTGIPFDVGDNLTHYCRENNLKYFCTDNTRHQPGNLQYDWAKKRISEPFLSFLSGARAIDDENNVLFMHLGRGTRRVEAPNMPARESLWIDNSEWYEFINSILD